MRQNETLISENKQLTLSDFSQLTKFRLSITVVISSIAGYFLAVDTVHYPTLLLLILGGYAMVGASNAFNQVFEKDLDKLMLRTQNRPLPTGRMQPNRALFIGVILTLIGISALYSINLKTAFFASLSIFLYACVYTPLKQKTPLSVFVGAFPGAIPFMLGWVAATNEFGIEPGVLFMIQFFWQFPHFWAIGWLMHDQYQVAGFKMLPSGARDHSTAFQTVFYTLWTVVISLLPAFHYTGLLVLSIPAAIGVGVLGLFFLFYAIRLMFLKTDQAARFLIRASIVYITGIQLVYVLDKFLIQ
ncbi:heme o synthase [Flavobacteriaceae bacterium]|jgi:protoheme IX farnesyltransferase|nr:protoheme IX farnesyltransferase [Flavobacteriaceae bacterium]MBT4313056.1 protoheme IX farnesyltransferase [Flavobacteriaceae bacterium]MBT5090891.1 protoheme IX farnesyltransferase [Flavobacteriaceae bacterium]MBT5282808.1 protoheme IX farnesyltransferase [Flavobacteriaceae bacterium]MBT5446126.1 protoheme IX farnesyltransferase [Flavobacteriaceae bacterium]|tara:strand:- start:24278 stop:25180 length:903 start_codon:yes stop_codon:yes gene_type:complete